METVKLTRAEHDELVLLKKKKREELEYLNSQIAMHNSMSGLVRCAWIVSDDAGFSIEIRDASLKVTGSNSPMHWEEETADYIIERMRETAIGPKLKKFYYKDWYVMMRDSYLELLERLDSIVVVVTDME